jgi:hypothetical protein
MCFWFLISCQKEYEHPDKIDQRNNRQSWEYIHSISLVSNDVYYIRFDDKVDNIPQDSPCTPNKQALIKSHNTLKINHINVSTSCDIIFLIS